MRAPAEIAQDRTASATYGLRQGGLSGLETLAQSISSIAPTAGPTVLIPLVFAAAGNGTWLSYLLATAAIFAVALNVSAFASHSATPGSLYSYTTEVLTGPAGQLSGWALLLAYLATASAVTGGFATYANSLLHTLLGWNVPPVLLAAAAMGSAIAVAYHDVEISARLMLWFEAVSVSLITLVIVLTLRRSGFHVDHVQFSLQGTTPGGIRLGLILAIFSFVGFESATTLGEEARSPLRTIPRAVLLSAVFAGLFFVFCAYSETLGFREAHQDLAATTAPLHVLGERAGLAFLAPVIDVGAALSFFACALSCITAAARVVLPMVRRGLAPAALGRIHPVNETPGFAIVISGLIAFIPPAVLFLRGAGGFDVNGWMGSLATYGFIVAYLLVSLANPIMLRRMHRLTAGAVAASTLAVIAMVAAFVGSIYPLPPAPYLALLAFFVVYMIAAYAWNVRQFGRTAG
jgi:amino acid transporter